MRIEAKNLIKIYGDRSVVNDVSFNINKGEVVCLLGPNGAGKTTTFYMVVGLVKPNKGSITLDGEEISSWPMHVRAKAGIGYLPQEASSFRSLSVEDNIKLVLQMNDKLTECEKKKKLEEQYKSEMEEMKQKHNREMSSSSYSSSKKQKIQSDYQEELDELEEQHQEEINKIKRKQEKMEKKKKEFFESLQKEAEKHILKMKEKGWEVYSPDGEIISYLGNDFDLPYEIRYIKY